MARKTVKLHLPKIGSKKGTLIVGPGKKKQNDNGYDPSDVGIKIANFLKMTTNPAVQKCIVGGLAKDLNLLISRR